MKTLTRDLRIFATRDSCLSFVTQAPEIGQVGLLAEDVIFVPPEGLTHDL